MDKGHTRERSVNKEEKSNMVLLKKFYEIKRKK